VLRRGRFFLGGGCLQFGRGELGWERKRKNRGGEGRQNGDINFCQWNHQQIHYVSDSIGNSDGELVMSL